MYLFKKLDYSGFQQFLTLTHVDEELASCSGRDYSRSPHMIYNYSKSDGSKEVADMRHRLQNVFLQN